jgi:hypothetical protein
VTAEASLSAIRVLFQRRAQHLVPLARRFVLVLVVVLVLDSLRAECWSTGVSEYCAFSELHPAAAGLEVLSGHLLLSTKPRVKTLGRSL